MIKGTRDTATYFSFYDVVEKLAVVIGTFSFGFVDQLSGSMRQSLLILSIYFVIGITLLLTMSSRQLDESQISTPVS